MNRLAVLVAFLVCLVASRAYADAALLLAEPSKRPSSFNPVATAGHVGVYLTRVCAASPTVLRRCRPGESGVVIGRYERVGVLDWVAIPLMPYLYAVERAADVPTFAAPDMVRMLRDQYRRARLGGIVPDAPGRDPSAIGTQLLGAAYDRQLIAFSVKTTPEQDDGLIAELNSRQNRRRYNVLFRNCADFARDLFRWYFPDSIRGRSIANLGITVPRQIAKALLRDGARRPDAGLAAYLIPQVAGNRRDSGRGAFESLLNYSSRLTIVQSSVPSGVTADDVTTRRLNGHRGETGVLTLVELEHHGLTAIDLHALASHE